MNLDALIAEIRKIDKRELLNLYEDDMCDIAKAVGAVAWDEGYSKALDDRWDEIDDTVDGRINPYKEEA